MESLEQGARSRRNGFQTVCDCLYRHNTNSLFSHAWAFLKTIIPRTHVGYELLDSGRGAEHRVAYNKLVSNKRELNNCFIKYQTLDKNILNLFASDSNFRPF